MKKAKITLAAIGAIAIVGGGLALKANHFTHSIMYTYGVSTTVIGGPLVTGCVVPVLVQNLKCTDVGSLILTTACCTTIITSDPAGCVALVTISANE